MSVSTGQQRTEGQPTRPPLRVLALIIDFRTTEDAARLSVQLAATRAAGVQLEAVHVDNGNAAPVELSPEQRDAGVRLIRIERNGGYASGIRAAINAARAGGTEYDAFFLLNSDLELGDDCLQRLAAVLAAEPGVGAVGPVVYKGRSARVWGARGVVSPWLGTTAMTPWPRGGALPRWSYIPGCSLLVRAAAYDSVGGIPDRYGMYYEETELCIQLQRAGWQLWVEPAAAAYHAVDSMKGGIPARHQAFYFTRNNLYFWRRNFGIPAALQLPRTLFVVLKDLVLPLRRAGSAGEALDRLRYILMGLADSRQFLRERYTRRERRHFDLAPPELTARS